MSLFFQILTIVLPIFLVIGLGYFLRRFGFLDEAFLHQTNRLIFYIALPLLLFYKIGTADFSANFNGALVIGSVGAIAVAFLLSYGYASLRRYPPGHGARSVKGHSGETWPISALPSFSMPTGKRVSPGPAF